MGIFNYIFIFLLLAFGLIESKNGEIVINEIMADPTPVAGLPDREYLELYNLGGTSVNLKNWILESGSKQKVFPDVSIGPGEFLLVTAPGGAKELQGLGKIVEISGFGLTNSGVVLSLYGIEKQLVDQVTYLPSMHSKGREDGGYALERIDPERMCGQGNNWATTLSAKGGTPGAENSVKASNPDQSPPQVISTSFTTDSRLEIQFTERLRLPAVLQDILENLSAGVSVDSIKMDQNSFLMQIWFHPATILNGKNYSATLQGVKDECGNPLADYPFKFGYYLPEKSDLLISEVLFNPFPDGADFVEIYNNSGHEVDLSELFLASRDETNALCQISQLSLKQEYLTAGSYLAVTKSKESILRFYRAGGERCLLELEKFPTLTDQSGTVVLLTKFQESIDEMNYNDGMHDHLIAETEGISLERISWSIPASRKENWHSAAKSTGYATPGYKNSVTAMADSIQKMVRIEPVVFSPNGDQINDQLNIYINRGEPGWILNVTILNCVGKIVRNLANNLTTSSSDVVVWDGLDDHYQNVEPGIYVLNISQFSRDGEHQSVRIACVVTDHL